MIDLHGWLSRILLVEFRRLGEQLHPSDPEASVLQEAEEFTEWLYRLAEKKAGELGSLTFRGRYFSVAIVFVADRIVLLERGIDPYRRRAKHHLYRDKFNSVYLLARDPNIRAVDELVSLLDGDAIIASKTRHAFRLRPDFEARKRLRRTQGICICLRRRQADALDDQEVAEDDADLAAEAYVAQTAAPPVPPGPVG